MSIALNAPAWTLASEQRDFVEWRKGRANFAVWALDLSTPALTAASENFRRHMGDTFLADYVRQPHLTLQIAGFPAKSRQFPDDYPTEEFHQQVEQLRALDLPPFAIEIGEVGSFTSAAYFSVKDHSGSLSKIRQALGAVEFDDFQYLPHLTFGLYRDQRPMAEVMRQMNAAPAFSPLTLEIGKISLMTYQAAVIGGLLTSQFEIKLNSAPGTQGRNFATSARCFD